MKQKKSFDDLVIEALENAQHDRELALEAYEKIKGIYDVDSSNPETMNSVLLIGQNAVKLLEQSSRSNEQIIRMAQLKEKEKRDKSESDEDSPITLADLVREAEASKVAVS